MKRGNRTNLREVVKARLANCDPGPHDADASEKVRKVCPDCNQFHLRPGYCQATDEVNRLKYPNVWQPELTPATEQALAAFNEGLRKRAAAKEGK